jgi:hypothetical protein
MFKNKIKPNKINFQIPKGPIQVIVRLCKSDNKIDFLKLMPHIIISYYRLL